MSLLFPLGIAALGALVPLIVLYILKQRREDYPISAAFLWQHALEDLRASSLFQRLRTPLLLFLQALAVILFALAAAGASLDLDLGREPRRTILVIDRSASMRATDEDGGSRFEVAIELAHDAVSGLRTGDEMMIIAFDDEAQVITSFLDEGDVLDDALDRLEARDLASEPVGALRLADSFAQASPGFKAEAIVISDGAVEGELPLLSCETRFARVGKSDENQGFADVHLEQMPGEAAQLFVRIVNGDDAPVSRSVLVRRNGEVTDARQVDLPASGDVATFFEFEEPEGDEVQILEVALDGEDILASDNRVRLLLRPAVPRTGVLVRPSKTVYLDPRKLEALHPGLAMIEATPDDAAGLVAAGGVDLVIYDGVSPAVIPEVAAQIYIGALPPDSGLISVGMLELPSVIDWDRTHPVTTRCQFDDVWVLEASDLSGHERSQPLVETTGDPLVLLTPVPGREVLVIAFDPSRSNLPLKLAWPLMLANSLDHLLRGVQRTGEEPLHETGAPIHDDEPFTVVAPGGEKHDSKPSHDGRAVFRETYDAGVYSMTRDDGSEDLRAFALLNAAEVRVRPREELVLGGDKVASAGGGLRRNVLLRDPLLLLVLGLLILEWAVWCGRR